MGNVVIVAIPEKDDYVWNISSEKVPHMTILNLGDALSDEDVAHAMGYIEHAANTSLRRFGLSVDRRGTLGKDDADVVFFDPASWDLEEVRKFRTFLLREDKIHTAVDLTPQFENWMPHLTLGYPSAPAKPDPREHHGIHYVNFDRIALWVDDFAGPEFELKRYSHDVVEHFGVKGMRWGDRADDSDVQVANKVMASAHKSGQADMQALAKKYKDVDMTKDSAERRAYDREALSMINKHLAAASRAQTMNRAGTKFTLVAIDRTGTKVVLQDMELVKTDDVQHADDEPIMVVARFVYDELGFVVGIEPDNPVKHYGVRGMKWGVRRTREQRSEAKKQEAQRHQDSARARELMKKKVSSLSNEELAFVNQRRQLEANYAKLNPKKSARRKQKIKGHLETLALIETTFKATQQPVAQRVIKKTIKKTSSPAAKKILKVLVAPAKGP